MNILKSFFSYSSSQRSGVFLLMFIIIVFQAGWYFYDSSQTSKSESSVSEKEWLAMQTEIDSIKLKDSQKKYEIKPFNPNFISDYKGYVLGMSVKEIDRLHKFRAQEKFVNSVKEFQQVTLVSDSLLNVISPYFKFPFWVNNKKEYKSYAKQTYVKKEKFTVIDINKALQADLIKVYGIGDALSLRILNEKEKLGGFVSMQQMQDIWGLSPEVVDNLNKSFNVSVIPDVKKIAINTASIKELTQFPYFKYALAKSIVTYRSMNGNISGIEDLAKIKGFPVEKINIIGLYLAF